tara:strand:- start:3864 stop:4742 length:879 start_codon:yes stop_codon:yes gene_type:complete
MNKNEAASNIEKQIISCLNIKVDNYFKHPIRLIQASKSLIGIDLKSPNSKLIEFNDYHLNSKNFDKFESITKTSNLNEVINIHELEEALLSKNKQKVFAILDQLSKVSSMKHILEFLIEFCLKQKSLSCLPIWSLYRSVLFIGEKHSVDYTNLIVGMILDSHSNHSKNKLIKSSYSIYKSDISILDLQIFSNLIEMKNTNLIRHETILPLIDSFISNEITSFKNNPKIKNLDSYDKERLWINNFINQFDKKRITIELLLFLDSIRCLLRNLDKSIHVYIYSHFERLLKKIDV